MDALTEVSRVTRLLHDGELVRVVLARPERGNAISSALIEEVAEAIALCEREAKVLVIEGTPEVFCLGADFVEIADSRQPQDPARLYALWQRLSSGGFVSIAHVRGKVNAGGVGFVAACDLVLAADSAVFSLSELLFGLMPACVHPFLARRVGHARAQYMTLSTQTIGAAQAREWGLVDAVDADSEALIRRHLVRVLRLPKAGIARYKRYVAAQCSDLAHAGPIAVAANREVFSDPQCQAAIDRFARTGRFPWEAP
jgi:polyketide biosynthesis enoyl-CoA hydratase PksH